MIYSYRGGDDAVKQHSCLCDSSTKYINNKPEKGYAKEDMDRSIKNISEEVQPIWGLGPR